jgi:hypothetical protein
MTTELFEPAVADMAGNVSNRLHGSSMSVVVPCLTTLIDGSITSPMLKPTNSALLEFKSIFSGAGFGTVKFVVPLITLGV